MINKKMVTYSSRDLNRIFNTGWDSKWDALFGDLFGFPSSDSGPLSTSDIERIMNFVIEDENLSKLADNDSDYNSKGVELIIYRFHHSFYNPDEEDHAFVFEKELQIKE